MKINVQELTGAALDWAVAKCEQPVYSDAALIRSLTAGVNGIGIEWDAFSPSTDWSQGGPIIEREGIQLHVEQDRSQWIASRWGYDRQQYGPTPLISAMRCYVASKLGDEVDVPEELL